MSDDIIKSLEVFESFGCEFGFEVCETLGGPQGQFLMNFLVEGCDEEGGFFLIDRHLFANGDDHGLLLIKVVLSNKSQHTLSTMFSTSLKRVPANLPSSLCLCDHNLEMASPKIQLRLANFSSSSWLLMYSSTTRSNRAILSFMCTFMRAS